MAFGSVLTKAKEKANSVKEKTGSVGSDAVAKAKEKSLDATKKASEAAFGKVSELSEQFNNSLPVLKEAGFIISEVEIEMGIPPKMKAHFRIQRELSDEEQADELEKVSDNKMLTNLLNALFKAYKIQKSIQMGDLKFNVIVIEVGFIPSVTIKFQ